NLYLANCLINQVFVESFSNEPTNFDLFYYTIITFTTIGYGDITPLSIPAKIMSIITALTSGVCVTIFLSTVLSYNDEKI
ncbi:MAG: potassium channel family protein, partial [Peptostreptococcaceae bacterium]